MAGGTTVLACVKNIFAAGKTVLAGNRNILAGGKIIWAIENLFLYLSEGNSHGPAGRKPAWASSELQNVSDMADISV